MSLLGFLIFYPHPAGEESDQEVGWVFSTHYRDIKQIFFILSLQPTLAQGESRSL